MSNLLRSLAELGIVSSLSTIVVVLLTFYLNHRPGSHDTKRVQIEEKRVEVEDETVEGERIRNNAEILEKVALLSQEQARADRERAESATGRAETMEKEVGSLREEVDKLRDTVKAQEATITALRDQVAEVIRLNRVYQRANKTLEGENAMLRDRLMVRGDGGIYKSKDDEDAQP